MAGKDRGASRYEPIGASINGIEILGARDLTHDMLLLRLAVPSRTTQLEAAELLAAGSALGHDISGRKQLGLLRRIENLYAGLPDHHLRLQREQQRQRDELNDLLANPPAPFEHSSALEAQQAELAALTLELRMAAESPEAKARAEAATQRMKIRGREPGWSLHLNPTPALVEELRVPQRRRTAPRCAHPGTHGPRTAPARRRPPRPYAARRRARPWSLTRPYGTYVPIGERSHQRRRALGERLRLVGPHRLWSVFAVRHSSAIGAVQGAASGHQT